MLNTGRLFLAALTLLVLNTQLTASTFKIGGEVFGDYYYVLSNHEDDFEEANGFWIRRIYLTVDHTLTESWDARLRFEMNSPGDFQSKATLDPFIKDAYIRWKGKNHRAILGMSPNPTWDLAERFWGYRSVEKTILDLQRMGNSRDLGIAVSGSITGTSNKLRYHAMFGNGAGTSSEVNEGKAVYLSLSYHPNDRWILEVYGDHNRLPDDMDRTTFHSFLGHTWNSGRFGIEYGLQKRDGTDSVALHALSLWSVQRIMKRVSAIVRYDRMFEPNPEGDRIPYIPFDTESGSNLLLIGSDIKLNDHFSLIPNIEAVFYTEDEGGTKPDSDFIARFTFSYNF